MKSFDNSALVRLFEQNYSVKYIIQYCIDNFGMKRENATNKVYSMLCKYNNFIVKYEKR